MIRKALFAALLPLVACSPAPAQDAEAPKSEPQVMDMTPSTVPMPDFAAMGGDIIGADGEAIGILNVIEGPHGLLIEVTIDPNGLAPGWHGLHLHQVGNCDDLGVFKNSGGHLGMIQDGHGLLNPIGPEIGDLPNIWAAIDGSAGYETFTSLVKLSDIADEDGTAMIIHANRDDHISQPIGGAGGRVACAVIG